MSQKKSKIKHHRNTRLVYPCELRIGYISPISKTSIIDQNETFHTSLKVFLTIAQVFSLMPINGVNATSTKSLHFFRCSLRNLYSSVIIGLNLAKGGIVFYWIILTKCDLDKIQPLIWFTVTAFVMYQFSRIARRWPSLMHHWDTFETNSSYRDVNTHHKMRRITHVTTVVLPVLALIEHVASLGNNLYIASRCKSISDTKIAYFKGAFPAYFYFFKVNYLNGIGLQLLNLYTTCAWTMLDTLIAIVSLGLITQFRHFNKNFERFKGMHLTPKIYGEQRVYFTKLTELLNHVNEDLAALILTSFVVNMFVICTQLFEIINSASNEPTERRFYICFSVIFFIGKTFTVLFVATIINDEAMKPINVLESVPDTSYGLEAARFMHQLTCRTIALGGMKFFFITRTLLVSVAGTIITYEIILMQFKNPQEIDYDPCHG